MVSDLTKLLISLARLINPLIGVVVDQKSNGSSKSWTRYHYFESVERYRRRVTNP
jgi:hypothetical protein